MEKLLKCFSYFGIFSTTVVLFLFFTLNSNLSYAGGHGGQHCGKKNCLAVMRIILGDTSTTMDLQLGGSGATDLPRDALGNLVPKPSFVWLESLLFAETPVFGEILVSLNPDEVSTGEMIPLSSDLAEFFPAAATNRFFFIMEIPQFNLKLFNKNPLINSTIVNSFPPFGSTYFQEHPVEFFDIDDPSGLPIVVIEESEVTISPEQGLECNIELLSSGPGNRVSFQGSVRNLTPNIPVELVWYVTGREGIISKHNPSHSIEVIEADSLNIDVISQYTGQERMGVMELYAASLVRGDHKWCFDSINVQMPTGIPTCDFDGDGDFDRNDISGIFSMRGMFVTDGIFDVDGDGQMTVNDARICTLVCDKPRCAP